MGGLVWFGYDSILLPARDAASRNFLTAIYLQAIEVFPAAGLGSNRDGEIRPLNCPYYTAA